MRAATAISLRSYDTKRFRKILGSWQLRRRLHGRLFELQKAVEEIEEGLEAGCLPDPLAAMLIARIEKRAAFPFGVYVSHAR